jgi:hypothetical protein
MPRGRPKGSKNKSTLIKMNLLETPKEEVPDDPPVNDPQPENNVKVEVTPKNSFKCEICEKVVTGNPYILDFVRMTAKPEYYRNARSKRMSVCNNCSKELSKLIDTWLLKKNPNLNKFPLTGVTYDEEELSALSRGC